MKDVKRGSEEFGSKLLSSCQVLQLTRVRKLMLWHRLQHLLVELFLVPMAVMLLIWQPSLSLKFPVEETPH